MRLIRRFAALLLALTLTLSLAAPAAAASGFTDVPAKHWAAAEIRRSAQAGLIRGETATRFGLGHSLTRGAFVSVLCRFFRRFFFRFLFPVIVGKCALRHRDCGFQCGGNFL